MREAKSDMLKYAQKLAKAAHSLSAEALGVPVEIFSADETGEDPKGKSRQAEPGRPAIYIE